MKRLILIFVILLNSSCSFDNKTGIWNDASNFPIDNQSSESINNSNVESKFEDLILEDVLFNEEKDPEIKFNLDSVPSIKISNWFEQYATSTNNISNFSYYGKKTLVSKSSKLSKFSKTFNYLNKSIIFFESNLISYDHNGKIFIYSQDIKKKTFVYDFYKKKFKNFKKKIYLIINDNILYAADNLGYIYAINLSNRSLLWAKNYGIPFRSNIKISNNQLFIANQDNVIYSINISSGVKNWQFATGLTFLKSDFENSFALDKTNNSLFFLNTNGELYSLNYLNQNINWILNFKNSQLSGDTNLFLSHPILIKYDNLIISTEKALFSYNKLNGTKNWSFPAELILKPVVTSDYTYLITKNDLLICLNNESGDVAWSKKIYKSLNKKKINKKNKKFYDLKIVNKEVYLFSNNGYLLSFSPSNGELINSKKISKNGISSEIVFLEDYMLLLDESNKLLKFN
jgi:outer membrane protein assembly factor BamB